MTLHQLTLKFPVKDGKKKVIFHSLSSRFPTTGLVVILGDSGIGKSSLLKVIAGEIKPQSGRVIYKQKKGLLPPIYLSDQLRLIKDWKLSQYGHQFTNAILVDALGLLPQDLSKTYGQLSGGQKVRLAVNLFLSQPAVAYLLDEPTHALDANNRTKLIEWLEGQAEDRLIIIATHDPDLIARAHLTLHLITPYQSLTFIKRLAKAKEQIQANPSHPKQDRLLWLKGLMRLHRGGWIAHGLWLTAILLQCALHGFTVLSWQLFNQYQTYQKFIATDPWLRIQEKMVTPIYDSPFQLVKTTYPHADGLRESIRMLKGVEWLEDIQYWFPQSIKVDGVNFQLLLTDFPFEEGQLSVKWIAHKMRMPSLLTVELASLGDDRASFSYTGPIRILEARPIISWFEPPQIHLSYWQWLWLLQTHTSPEQPDQLNYYQDYLHTLPIPHALIYDPHHQLRQVLEDTEKYHAWSWQSPIKMLHPWVESILIPILDALPVILIVLFGLWGLVWWTRLHWVYQRHRKQWLWLLALHEPFASIWSRLTHRLVIRWRITLGLIGSGMTLLIGLQRWLSVPSVWTILFIQAGLWVVMIVAQTLLLKGYRHA